MDRRGLDCVIEMDVQETPPSHGEHWGRLDTRLQLSIYTLFYVTLDILRMNAYLRVLSTSTRTPEFCSYDPKEKGKPTSPCSYGRGRDCCHFRSVGVPTPLYPSPISRTDTRVHVLMQAERASQYRCTSTVGLFRAKRGRDPKGRGSLAEPRLVGSTGRVGLSRTWRDQ